MSALIGGLAGAVEITCSYPLEYTKVSMQLYSKLNQKGALKVARDTVKKRGPLGLYKGYNCMLLFAMPKSYVRFGVYDYMRNNVLHNYEKTNPLLTSMFCGMAAGLSEGLVVMTPSENIKIKMIHDTFMPKRKYKNLFQGIYKISKQQGMQGLWKGSGVTGIKLLVNNAIHFPVFHILQNKIRPYFNESLSPVRDMTAGAATGVLSVIVTQPLDVVKTNL